MSHRNLPGKEILSPVILFSLLCDDIPDWYPGSALYLMKKYHVLGNCIWSLVPLSSPCWNLNTFLLILQALDMDNEITFISCFYINYLIVRTTSFPNFCHVLTKQSQIFSVITVHASRIFSFLMNLSKQLVWFFFPLECITTKLHLILRCSQY